MVNIVVAMLAVSADTVQIIDGVQIIDQGIHFIVGIEICRIVVICFFIYNLIYPSSSYVNLLPD